MVQSCDLTSYIDGAKWLFLTETLAIITVGGTDDNILVEQESGETEVYVAAFGYQRQRRSSFDQAKTPRRKSWTSRLHNQSE